MPDKKPKTTVESTVEPAEAADKRTAAQDKKATVAVDTADAPAATEGGDKGGSFASVRSNVSSWLQGNFPGHENAFIGGACGLLAILLIYTIGLGKTLLIALFLVAGIAIGQIFDGDPKIIHAIQHLFEARNQ